MKALKIYEIQKFEHGGNSYKKLQIGSHKPRFKHGDQYKDENNHILTYNKYVDEFWYDKKNTGGIGEFLDIQAQYVYDNPDMFTHIVESQEFIQGGVNPYKKLQIGSYSEFKHGDQYKDKNNHILTYDENLDEFWYLERVTGITRYLQAQYVSNNPNTFTRIINI